MGPSVLRSEPARPYAEALRSLQERIAEIGGGPALLGFLNSPEYHALASCPGPVGRSERASAVGLWDCLFRHSQAYGNNSQAASWLLRAIREDSVSPSVVDEAAALFLDQGLDAGSHLPVLLRWLRSGRLSPQRAIQLRGRLTASLNGSPSASPELARATLQYALLPPIASGGSGESARLTAAALCALNRGAMAAPSQGLAESLGAWPVAFAPLLAYSHFLSSDWRGAADLLSKWPADPASLGPAEPGARLRCGLALLRLGATPEAEQLIRSLAPRFGWICERPLALISQLRSNPVPCPEAWLEAFWNAAAAAVNGGLDPLFQLTQRWPVASETERRWITELLAFALRSALDRSAWADASRLLNVGRQASIALLPAWQAVLVHALAGSPPSLDDDLRSFFWRSRAQNAAEAVHLAAAAALCGSEEAPRLVARAWSVRGPSLPQALLPLLPEAMLPSLCAAAEQLGWHLDQVAVHTPPTPAELPDYLTRIVTEEPVLWAAAPGAIAPFSAADLACWAA